MNEQQSFTYIHYPWDSRISTLEQSMLIARLDFCFVTNSKSKPERVNSAIAFLQNYINWNFAFCDTETIAAIFAIHKFSLLDGKNSHALSLLCNAWHFVSEKDIRQYSILKAYNQEKLVEEIMARYLYRIESLLGGINRNNKLRAALALIILLRLQKTGKGGLLVLYLTCRW